MLFVLVDKVCFINVFYCDLVLPFTSSTFGTLEKSALRTIKKIYTYDGIRGLYRGLGITVVATGFSSAVFRFVFENTRMTYALQRPFGLQTVEDESFTIQDNMIASCVAGTISAIMFQPLWFAKSRLESSSLVGTQSAPQNIQNGPVDMSKWVRYTGATDCLRQVILKEGWRSTFNGLASSIALVPHGVIQMVVYEWMRTRHNTFLHAVHGMEQMGQSPVSCNLKQKNDEATQSNLNKDHLNISHHLPNSTIDNNHINNIDNNYSNSNDPYVAVAAPQFNCSQNKSILTLPLNEYQTSFQSYIPENVLPFFWGVMSKMAAASVSYPLQVVRARQQMQASPFAEMTIPRVLKEIVRTEGFMAVYSGFAVNMARASLANGILFSLFEWLRLHSKQMHM